MKNPKIAFYAKKKISLYGINPKINFLAKTFKYIYIY